MITRIGGANLKNHTCCEFFRDTLQKIPQSFRRPFPCIHPEGITATSKGLLQVYLDKNKKLPLEK
jgi:hypothetical protein